MVINWSESWKGQLVIEVWYYIFSPRAHSRIRVTDWRASIRRRQESHIFKSGEPFSFKNVFVCENSAYSVLAQHVRQGVRDIPFGEGNVVIQLQVYVSDAVEEVVVNVFLSMAGRAEGGVRTVNFIFVCLQVSVFFLTICLLNYPKPPQARHTVLGFLYMLYIPVYHYHSKHVCTLSQ